LDKVILYLIGTFFVVSAIDYALGCPFKLGQKFEEGIKTMGPLGLGMIGILSLAPVLSNVLSKVIMPISEALGIDPSIVPAMFFAVDMGGFQMSSNIYISKEIGLFAGVVVASTIGTVISFTIPVAMGIIEDGDKEYFFKGVLIGTISLPIGCIVAGIFQGLKLNILLWNMIPIFIISLILSVSLLLIPKRIIKILNIFGKLIVALSIIGLILQGIDILFGYKIINGLAPFSEVASIIVKISIVLSGAYPMIYIIKRLFSSSLEKIGGKFGLNAEAVSGIIGNLASNLLIFGIYKEMNPKGKVVAAAFSVSGAFVFGGQFGFVSGLAPEMLGSFMIAKLIAGIISIILASWIYEREVLICQLGRELKI